MSKSITLFDKASLNLDSPTFILSGQRTIIAVGMQPGDYITFEVLKVNPAARSIVCGCRLSESGVGSIDGIQELKCPTCETGTGQSVRLTERNPVVVLDAPQEVLLRAIYHGDGVDMSTVTVWAVETSTQDLTDSMRGCPPVCCEDEAQTWVGTGETRCSATQVEVQEISNCGNYRWVVAPVQPAAFWNPTGTTQCSLINDIDTLQQETNPCGQVRWVAGPAQVWNATGETRCVAGNIETQQANQCGRTRYVAGGAVVWVATGVLNCSVANDTDTLQQETNQCGELRFVAGPAQIWVETGATRPAGAGFEVQETNQCGRFRWVAGEASEWIATGEINCSTVNDTDTIVQEVNQAGRYRWVVGPAQVWTDTCCTRCNGANFEHQQTNQCGRTRWVVSGAVVWTANGDFFCDGSFVQNEEVNQCGTSRWVQGAAVVWTPNGNSYCSGGFVHNEEVNQCGTSRWVQGAAVAWTFTGVQYCIDSFLNNQEVNQCGETRIVTTASACSTPVAGAKIDFETSICWRSLAVLSEVNGNFIDVGDVSSPVYNEAGDTFIAMRVASANGSARHDSLFVSGLNQYNFVFGSQIQQSNNGVSSNLILQAPNSPAGGPLVGVGHSVTGVNGKYQPGSSFTESFLAPSGGYTYYVFKVNMANTTGSVGLEAYSWGNLAQLKVLSEIVRGNNPYDMNGAYANDSVSCVAPQTTCSTSNDILFPGSQSPTTVYLPGAGVAVAGSTHTVTLTNDASGGDIIEGESVCWTVTLNAPVTGADLVVTPVLSGTEQAVHSYGVSPFVIAIGASVGTFCVLTTDDALIEGTLVLCLDLAAGTNPRLTNAPQSSCINVLDNDVANTASVTTTTPNINEGSAAVYRVTLSTAAPGGGITGNLTFSGTEQAAHAANYPVTAYTVTVGNTFVDVPMLTVSGDGVDGNTILTATITSVSGGYTIAGSPADVTVVDTDSAQSFSIPAPDGDCKQAPQGGGSCAILVARDGSIGYYSTSVTDTTGFWVSPDSPTVGDAFEVQFNGGPWLALTSDRIWQDECYTYGCIASLNGILNIRRTIGAVVVASRDLHIVGRGNYYRNWWVCP